MKIGLYSYSISIGNLGSATRNRGVTRTFLIEIKESSEKCKPETSLLFMKLKRQVCDEEQL